MKSLILLISICSFSAFSYSGKATSKSSSNLFSKIKHQFKKSANPKMEKAVVLKSNAFRAVLKTKHPIHENQLYVDGKKAKVLKRKNKQILVQFDEEIFFDRDNLVSLEKIGNSNRIPASLEDHSDDEFFERETSSEDQVQLKAYKSSRKAITSQDKTRVRTGLALSLGYSSFDQTTYSGDLIQVGVKSLGLAPTLAYSPTEYANVYALAQFEYMIDYPQIGLNENVQKISELEASTQAYGLGFELFLSENIGFSLLGRRNSLKISILDQPSYVHQWDYVSNVKFFKSFDRLVLEAILGVSMHKTVSIDGLTGAYLASLGLKYWLTKNVPLSLGAGFSVDAKEATLTTALAGSVGAVW